MTVEMKKGQIYFCLVYIFLINIILYSTPVYSLSIVDRQTKPIIEDTNTNNNNNNEDDTSIEEDDAINLSIEEINENIDDTGINDNIDDTRIIDNMDDTGIIDNMDDTGIIDNIDDTGIIENGQADMENEELIGNDASVVVQGTLITDNKDIINSYDSITDNTGKEDHDDTNCQKSIDVNKQDQNTDNDPTVLKTLGLVKVELEAVKKDSSDVIKDASDVKKDASDVNKDDSDVNKDASNINKDASNINKVVDPAGDTEVLPGGIEMMSDLKHKAQMKEYKDDLNLHYNYNYRPIIGVLAQEMSNSMTNVINDPTKTSYIAASYVKYLESAGARVVPILINKTDDYYKMMVGSLNAIVFPGGSASITNTSGYGYAGQVLYNLAKTASPPLPVWGTCLGFEMLIYLAADQVRPLTRCNASNTADKLVLQKGWHNSDLFRYAPLSIIHELTHHNTTTNFHKWCVTPKTFYDLGLNDTVKMLANSYDRNNTEYVATVEFRGLPIYGTQWHPEKTAFEWANHDRVNGIPHDRASIRVSQYMANFFVKKAQLSHNSFLSDEEEAEYLIYNYSPIYVSQLYKSSFVQVYIFP